MKIANFAARTQVQNRVPFTGNNTFAERVGDSYIVYSYGEHWPLFVYRDGQWYENGDRYSVTTSKHRSQLHPLTDTHMVSSDELCDMVRNIKRPAYC